MIVEQDRRIVCCYDKVVDLIIMCWVLGCLLIWGDVVNFVEMF